MFKKSINSKKVRSDFAFLEEKYGFILCKIDVPGYNDVMILYYKNKSNMELRIERDRGYYEVNCIVKSEPIGIDMIIEYLEKTKVNNTYSGEKQYIFLKELAQKHMAEIVNSYEILDVNEVINYHRKIHKKT